MVILLFLVTFLVVLKIVREYYASNWNKGLSASVRFGAECINEGETGHICEEIINDKFLPLPVVLNRLPPAPAPHSGASHMVCSGPRFKC